MSGYQGKLESPGLSGEGAFRAEEEGLSVSTLFENRHIDYEDIETFRYEHFSVYVRTADSLYRFYHMGQQNEWLYLDLKQAYDKQVCAALLVSGEPVLTAQGLCSWDGGREQGSLLVYPDCLCLLPQSKEGRRYPIAMINGLKQEGYALTVKLTTGEQCTASMLGADLEPLQRDITGAIRQLRSDSKAFAQRVCPELSPAGADASAGVFWEGLASPLEGLEKALRETLIKKARNSKMGPYFDGLLRLGDGKQLALGLKELDEETVEELKAALLEKLNAKSETTVTLTPQQEDALRWVVWGAVPSLDGQSAIVEFAFPNEDAATYLFRLEEDFASFLPRLNRALEASQLGRELFSGPPEKLSRLQRMLITRTPAIETLRRAYLGKAIHRSPEAWAKSIRTLTAPREQPPKACPQCGKPLAPKAVFCGHCGARCTPATPGLCPGCGARNPATQRFCGQCGTKLIK